jgi:hypothetical protein
MNFIQKQIEESINSDGGYFPNPQEIYRVQTDINVFPYNRFFRGEPESSEPIIWEREAGFQEILPQTFEKSKLFLEKEPERNTCFQIPCSTILPCNKLTSYKNNTTSCLYTSP